MERDLKHLRWLSYWFYFAAIISGLILIIPLLWIFSAQLEIYIESINLGLSWYYYGVPDIRNIFEEGNINPIFTVVVMIFGFIIGGTMLVSAVCNYYCAKSLNAQKRYVFCLVMSGLHLASFPFGTILGIFSLLVLLRESVKLLFEEKI